MWKVMAFLYFVCLAITLIVLTAVAYIAMNVTASRLSGRLSGLLSGRLQSLATFVFENPVLPQSLMPSVPQPTSTPERLLTYIGSQLLIEAMLSQQSLVYGLAVAGLFSGSSVAVLGVVPVLYLIFLYPLVYPLIY